MAESGARNRSNDRTPVILRSKPVMGIVLMALGVTLLAMGLPENWIDLAALTLAAVTAVRSLARRPLGGRRDDRSAAGRAGRERHPRNYLAFLGLAAALCCYKRLLRLTTYDTVLGAAESP
ncbi:hypothetical protein ACFVH0_32555 [Streptomyces sp. NPDC127117]|uniref:hypothetical protein n=1 Tax=Streptomyces sp. NPDC127117 TaxID=3345368 RepID=UPI00362890D5